MLAPCHERGQAVRQLEEEEERDQRPSRVNRERALQLEMTDTHQTPSQTTSWTTSRGQISPPAYSRQGAPIQRDVSPVGLEHGPKEEEYGAQSEHADVRASGSQSSKRHRSPPLKTMSTVRLCRKWRAIVGYTLRVAERIQQRKRLSTKRYGALSALK